MSTRVWRRRVAVATAGLFLLTVTGTAAAAQTADDTTDGADAGTPADATASGIAQFAASAEASGATVCIGLPAALADGLAPVLGGLGIAGSCELGEVTTTGIRLDLAAAEAQLRRIADEATGEEGAEIEAEADAFVTNLLLAADAADQPGACTGGPMDVALPPGDTPLLHLTLLGVDCAAGDERAFADVRIAGVDLRLGNLIALGLPAEARDGVGQAVDALNQQLLAELQPALCELTDPVLEQLLGDASLCEEDAEGIRAIVQVRNPLEVDVPLLDLGVVGATTEVVQDGHTVTATATSTFAGLNALGIACAGGDAETPFTFTSTATTDGVEATRSASVTDLQARSCAQEQSLLRLIATEAPLGDVAVLERILQEDLLDGRLDAAFDAIERLLDALSTQAITQGEAYTGEVDGAGATAGTTPFVVAATLPLAALPGLGDVAGELAVVVHANETSVGVNAAPAPPAPEPEVVPAAVEPEEPLPHTGTDPLTAAAGAALLAAGVLLTWHLRRHPS